MHRALAAVAVVAALPLAACGSAEESTGPLTNREWQAVGIYTSPDAPSTIPENATEIPSMAFGGNSALGTTGCARFRADLTYTAQGNSAHPDDADAFHIDEIAFEDKDPSCEGEAAWAHTRLTQLLATGSDFAITIDSNDQLIITLKDGKVDSPAIRFAAV